MKSIFFCDLRGTFLSDSENRNTETDLKEFVSLLASLDKNETLDFSFVTSDEVEILIGHLNDLAKLFVGTKINLSTQYGFDKAIENGQTIEVPNGKVFQIMRTLEGNNYNHIYIADNSFSNQRIFKYLGFTRYQEIPMTQLIPGNSYTSDQNDYSGSSEDLKGLNELLKRYILEKNNQKVLQK